MLSVVLRLIAVLGKHVAWHVLRDLAILLETRPHAFLLKCSKGHPHIRHDCGDLGRSESMTDGYPKENARCRS